MKALVKGIITILLMSVCYLDVMSCRPVYATIRVYSYDGESFLLEKEEKVQRYHLFSYSEYDDISLDGYTFLGWYASPYSIEAIDEMTEKYSIYETIADRATSSMGYYPLFVKNEELDTFLQTSPLAKVNICVVDILDGNRFKDKTYLSNLLETYESSLENPSMYENYEFVGYSLERLDYEDYYIDGIPDDLKINVKSQLPKCSNITIYAYYLSN